MSPIFTPTQLLYFSFVTFWQFIFVPVLAIGLIVAATKGRQKTTLALSLLLVALAPLLAIQVYEFLAVLPSPFRLGTVVLTNLFNAALPLWFFFGALAAAGFMLSPQKWLSQPAKERWFRALCRIVGIISLGLLAISGAVYLEARLTPASVNQTVVIPPISNPQYYVPARPIKNMRQTGIKFDGEKLLISYQDQYGQTIILTETPNSPVTIKCSEYYLEMQACVDILKDNGTIAVAGKPSNEYVGQPGKGYWLDGYSEVHARIGTTLLDLYEPTSDHVLSDDFADYFAGFKKVGKSQISQN